MAIFRGGWFGERLRFRISRLSGFASLLQLAKGLVSTVVDAVETGLVARDEGEGAGVVGQVAEGDRQMDAGIEAIDFGSFGEHFRVKKRGFDGPEAAETPTGGDHFLDQILFGGRGRVVDSEEIIENLLEFDRVLTGEDNGAAGGEAVLDGVKG